MTVVLQALIGCCVLVFLVCCAGAAYCWFTAASRHAKPGAGDRFMMVGFWTNLTPEGNRLIGKGFAFFLASAVAWLLGVGLTLLLRAVGR